MRIILCSVALLALLLPAVGAAGQDVQTEIDSLKARLQQLESQVAEQEKEAIRRDEIRKLVQEVAGEDASKAALPKWLQGVKFKGDLRVRFEGHYPESGEARNRARFRLRLGVTKSMLDDQLLVGFRLASGDKKTATSTNQTFDDFLSKKAIWIDRAYFKYAPKWFDGFALLGGKTPNPLVHTDLVWDSDVNPEGFVAAYTHDCGAVKPFISGGYWIIDEVKPDNGHDITLATYQLGTQWKVCDKVKWTTAATYYDYNKLNITTAEAFRMINLTNKFAWKIGSLPMSAYFDWIYNCGDKDETPGFVNANTGYAAGVKVGTNKAAGDWSASYKYAYIQANATPGILNDSDFGGSNRKGHVIGGKVNLAKNVTLGGKVFLVEDIAGDDKDLLDTLVQADLVISF